MISIITINLNNATGLQKTITSVLAQSSSEFEYIIIDGDSIDGSQGLIAELSQIHNKFNINTISEKDSGIYNAMNKGIRLAKGEYLHFLNSGDWLENDRVVEDMISEIKKQEQPDILIGNKIMVRPDNRIKKCKNDNKPVSVFTFYRGTIEHTSAYIRRSLFDEYGLYDEQLKIVSDWKWYLQAVGLGNAKVAFADCYVSCFDTTGISNTNRELEMKERRLVLEQLIPPGVLRDYDRYTFDIIQMERLKRYPVIYKFVWFVERLLFKRDKWLEQKRRWK
jgi:glycosyltransferase involved in cell wall biosynthesis